MPSTTRKGIGPPTSPLTVTWLSASNPANGKIALTSGQGVFEPPLKDGADNPARHIRLGLGFFAPNVTDESAAFILIHELAHFTGRRDGEFIDDNGRGWFDDIFIKPLGTRQRLLIARSSAMRRDRHR